MSRFWAIFTLLVSVPIFAVAIYLVVEGAEGSLLPFLILVFSALCYIPYLVKRIIKNDLEKLAERKKLGKACRFLAIDTIVSAIVAGGLGVLMLNYKGSDYIFTYKDVLGVFVGVWFAILIIYLFMWVLPKKLGLED